MTHVVQSDEGAITELPGVKARRLIGADTAPTLGGLSVSEVVFLDDHTNPGHSHPEQEVFYFLDPVVVELEDPAEVLALSSGDCLYVSSGRFHRVVSASSQQARAVIIKSGKS